MHGLCRGSNGSSSNGSRCEGMEDANTNVMGM